MDFCSSPDCNNQETGGQRVERAAVADFFVLSARRVIATTSCDVMPAALSTSRTPSISVPDFIRESFQKVVFYLFERAIHASARGHGMSAAMEFFCKPYRHRFWEIWSGAHAHLTFGEFLKKYGGLYALDRAQVINNAFVVLRKDFEFFNQIQREEKVAMRSAQWNSAELSACRRSSKRRRGWLS